MLVVREEGSLLCVTQPDHAHFSGELMSLWRADGLPGNPRRAEVLFAIRQHDNGWREADSAPRCDPARGRPHDFRTLDDTARREIWERGTARFADEHPYAALLIGRHALTLLGERRGKAEWEPFLTLLTEQEAELLTMTGAGPADAAADYRLLDLADQISLLGCGALGETFERSGARGELRGGNVHLHPFPFAGATTFQVPCRRIPDRAYGGDADVGGELAAARWSALSVRLVE
jgi:Protein of unknown function (DUF3891)